MGSGTFNWVGDNGIDVSVRPSKPVLFLPCSGSKASGILPAIEKYTGSSVWGLLRKCPARFATLQTKVQIVIVSAQYGVLYPHEPINDYDATMTHQQAAKLTNIHQRQKLSHILSKAGSSSIYLALPHAYRKFVEDLAPSLIQNDNVHRFPPGSGIGRQRQQINNWMNELIA